MLVEGITLLELRTLAEVEFIVVERAGERFRCLVEAELFDAEEEV